MITSNPAPSTLACVVSTRLDQILGTTVHTACGCTHLAQMLRGDLTLPLLAGICSDCYMSALLRPNKPLPRCRYERFAVPRLARPEGDAGS